MSALPPEVRRFLAFALRRHDAGCKRFVSSRLISGVCELDAETLREVVQWCEARSLLTLPRVGPRYRHWRRATMEWERVRVLLEGRA